MANALSYNLPKPKPSALTPKQPVELAQPNALGKAADQAERTSAKPPEANLLARNIKS